jgi:hypothetical protein
MEAAQVLARFIMCDDPDVLADIVKFNKTQNKVEAADFRSKDPVRERRGLCLRSVPPGLKNSDTVQGALDDFQALIQATADANRTKYDVFASHIA